MAQDHFTDADGTLLVNHVSGGITWAPFLFAEVQGEISGGVVNCGAGSNVFARASNSTSDYCEIVFKAGSYGAESKSVHVRASASNEGYWIQCLGAPTGNIFTELQLRKANGYFAAAPVSMDRTQDNIVAIRATTAGSDVQIQGWLNGVALVWGFSLPGGSGAASTTFTDPAANTPILSGNPAFSHPFESGMSQAMSGFDDFNDTQGGGPVPGAASGAIGAVSASAPAGTASSARSVLVTLRNGSGSLLSGVTRRFWTRATLDAAAVDGGAGGLSVTCNGAGEFTLTGLNIASGAGWLTYKDPADDLNCHTVPVTFV